MPGLWHRGPSETRRSVPAPVRDSTARYARTELSGSADLRARCTRELEGVISGGPADLQGAGGLGDADTLFVDEAPQGGEFAGPTARGRPHRSDFQNTNVSPARTPRSR